MWAASQPVQPSAGHRSRTVHTSCQAKTGMPGVVHAPAGQSARLLAIRMPCQAQEVALQPVDARAPSGAPLPDAQVAQPVAILSHVCDLVTSRAPGRRRHKTALLQAPVANRQRAPTPEACCQRQVCSGDTGSVRARACPCMHAAHVCRRADQAAGMLCLAPHPQQAGSGAHLTPAPPVASSTVRKTVPGASSSARKQATPVPWGDHQGCTQTWGEALP